MSHDMSESEAESVIDKTEHMNRPSGSKSRHTNPFETREVIALACRLPTFTPHDVDSWFLLADSCFFNANITREVSKFHKTVECLGIEHVKKFRSFLATHPEKKENPYKLLCEKVTAYFKPSIKQEFGYTNQLQLGENKPSFLLEQLKAVMGDNVSDAYLEFIWRGKLPSLVAFAVQSSKLPLNEKADMADLVYADLSGCDNPWGQVTEATAMPPQTFATTNPFWAQAAPAVTPPFVAPPTPIMMASSPFAQQTMVAPVAAAKASTETSQLIQMLQKMDRRLDKLEGTMKRETTNGRRDHSPARERATKRNNPDYCYYHNRFGNLATKCREGCLFPKN